MNRTLVVVGHGMVGHRLAEELRTRDRADTWRVVIVSDETRPAYDRVALSSYLDGKTAADLSLVSDDFLHDPMVELRLGVSVEAIDRKARAVTCSDGTTIGYDRLVLATGSRPFVPPIPGRDLPGCFVYRTLDDLDAIRVAAGMGRAGVVVGGGLLGLEAANALRLLGLRPRVIEIAPRLMPMQLDDRAGALVAELVGELGVTVHCGVATRSINAAPDGRVGAVNLTDGTTLTADVVVFAAGVRPRDDLARAAGLDMAERGGVLVDDHCRTSDPDISAIGECAAVHGRCYGLLAPGYRMADVVVAQLLGEAGVGFCNADTSTQLKLMGVDVASFGDALAVTEGTLELAYSDNVAHTYAKLVLGPDTRTLLGGILVGRVDAYPVLRSLLGRELPAPPERLLFGPG